MSSVIASFAARFALIGATIIAALMAPPVAAQGRMVLGPRQFESDKSGAGAVLCAWSFYLSVQAQTVACALPRRPTDDAIDQAIVAIDQFILENSSLHPTKEALEAFRRDAAALSLRPLNSRPQLCQGSDLEKVSQHRSGENPSRRKGAACRSARAGHEPLLMNSGPRLD
ncbi:hypothetical protein H8B02_20165 [Bradyrhizobium sp. Pear77]|uniref:hypothetical protein n=1 Tax=Bradyrhizobium altum TaxID=1571202 RepID=UPI001E61869B|nr:hypothetical protein [Bradyrhizobium altum]MCC8955662.1 hypothetical protein [Bradyrhizobium altum]